MIFFIKITIAPSKGFDQQESPRTYFFIFLLWFLEDCVEKGFSLCALFSILNLPHLILVTSQAVGNFYYACTDPSSYMIEDLL